MRLLFLILFFVITYNVSISQHWEEVKSITGIQNEEAGDIASDKDGNICVTGIFSGEAYFNDDTIQSLGDNDIFLAKYNGFDTLLWVRQIKGPALKNLLYSRIIGFDNANNIYITGYFYDEISFDGNTLESRGGTDIFIAKYNPSGNLIWTKHEGASNYEGAISGSIDNSGNIVIGGFFYDFTFLGNDLFFGVGNRDIFIAKYNTFGHFRWAKTEGGHAVDYINDIVTVMDNSIYISGYFSDDIVFSDSTLSTNGGVDIFLVKYNPFGNLIWARNTGGVFNEYSESIFVDDDDNIYMCGYFSTMVSFDTIELYSNGLEDIFVTSFDPDGNVKWATGAGSMISDKGRSIVVDEYHNSYITGYFYGDITFGDISFTNQGERDAFLTIIDKDGEFITAKQIYGSANDEISSLCIDNNTDIYITGQFDSPSTNFDSTVLYNVDYYDVFIAQLSTSSYVACFADFSFIYDTIQSHFEFTDLSKGEIIKWHWDFGDGDTSDIQDPIHVYDDYGTYNVCLAITAVNPFSNYYCTDTICKMVYFGKPNIYNMGGQVFAGTYPLDAGIAYLYRILSNNYVMAVDTFHFDTLGYYYFYQVIEGTYIVKADPEYFSSSFKSYIPTYYGDWPHWQEASLINLFEDNYSLDIDLIRSKGYNQGPGKIYGNIMQVKTKPATDEGPVQGVEILLKDINDNILDLTYSDIYGNFNFSNLEFGIYKVYAEITGMTTNPVIVTLDEVNPVWPSINLIIINREIIAGIDEIKEQLINVTLFPNPFPDHVTLELFLSKPNHIKIKLYNELGQLTHFYQGNFPAGKQLFPLSLAHLPDGLYYLELDNGDGEIFVRKLIKADNK